MSIYTRAVINLGVRSRAAILFGCAALGAASIGGTAVAAAPVAHRTPAPSGPQGGYVVTPQHFRSARLEVRVPVLHCAQTADRSVRVGIFGHTRYQQSTTPWFVAVTAACRAGQARYRAGFGDGYPMAVHAGDLVRLIADSGSTFEIDNLTTGAGTGGAAGSPGKMTTLPRVVLGGRRSGAALHVGVAITRAAVNGHAISAVPHHRQRQVVGGATAVAASAVTEHGTAFDLAIR